jgi:hypothetical protein
MQWFRQWGGPTPIIQGYYTYGHDTMFKNTLYILPIGVAV